MPKNTKNTHCFPNQKGIRLGNRNCKPCRIRHHKQCWDRNKNGKVVYEDGMFCQCSCIKCHKGSYTIT